jgi:membrane-associated phospholipid phosphatase
MPENNDADRFVYIHLTRSMYLFIAISSLILFTLAVFLWLQGTIDQNITIAHNALYEQRAISGVFEFFSKYGMALIAAVYVVNLLLSYGIEELKSSYPLYILIFFSFGLGGLTGDLLKEVFDKARPVVELAGQISRTDIPSSPAFPSGHATKSMALALPYVLLISRSYHLNRIFRLMVFGIAILVCYSRIVLQAHYLSDVLAGIGTAFAFIPVAVFLSNKVYKIRKVDEKALERMVMKLGVALILLTVLLNLI